MTRESDDAERERERERVSGYQKELEYNPSTDHKSLLDRHQMKCLRPLVNRQPILRRLPTTTTQLEANEPRAEDSSTKASSKRGESESARHLPLHEHGLAIVHSGCGDFAVIRLTAHSKSSPIATPFVCIT